MPTKTTLDALADLFRQAAAAIQGLPQGPARFVGATALFDSDRDRVINQLPAFAPTEHALRNDEDLIRLYGPENAARLALQFVYESWNRTASGASIDQALEAASEAFEAEAATPTWRFTAIANINNFSYNGTFVDLGDGVSIQGRNFERLVTEYGWDDLDLARLSEDWSAGGGASSYILVVETKAPKTPANFVLSSDGASYGLSARALLALRLSGPGSVSTGRFALHRPGHFNVGVGGRAYSGMTLWIPGSPYVLTDDMLPAVRSQIQTLRSVETVLNTSARHVGLALRSFSSTYDRLFHQGEDAVLDCITALEALWKLDGELAFRVAFRTSTLLEEQDDHRDSLFDLLRTYYKLRSKIVHGTVLGPKEQALLTSVGSP